ncbi:MAG: RNA polymerase sigma factor [Polyangiaceae bacterium]
MNVTKPDPTVDQGPNSILAKGLADARLRDDLVAFARKRVPESDAEDIVQAAFMEVLSGKSVPSEPTNLRAFVFGIVKNKLKDHHRRSRREVASGDEDFEAGSGAADDAPTNASLLRWAEGELPPGSDGKRTFEWMLREGDGEKLETIANDAKVPPARVRQRVSRLRRHLKTRWLLELAVAVLAVGVLVFVILRMRKERARDEAHGPGPSPTATVRPVPSSELEPRLADDARRRALDACGKEAWAECLRHLDEAKRLDPAGESIPEVHTLRRRAESALTPAPTPSTVPTVKGPTVPAPQKFDLSAPLRGDSMSSPVPPAPTPSPARRKGPSGTSGP